MRIGRFVGCLVCVIACGNQEAPPATTPTATATAAPSAAPVASESAAPVASAAPSASAAPVASAAPAAPSITKTLKELVGGAKTIKIAWREKLDSNEAKTVTVNTAATIKGILDAVGPDQTPGGSTPAYMWTYTFRFEDAQGNPLATVSLFASATMSDSKKKDGRIDVANGTFGGVTVAKYEDLQKRLKAIGITLP